MCFKSWFEALDLGTENTELGNGNYLETALEEEIAVSSHDVLNSLKEDASVAFETEWSLDFSMSWPKLWLVCVASRDRIGCRFFYLGTLS